MIREIEIKNVSFRVCRWRMNTLEQFGARWSQQKVWTSTPSTLWWHVWTSADTLGSLWSRTMSRRSKPWKRQSKEQPRSRWSWKKQRQVTIKRMVQWNKRSTRPRSKSGQWRAGLRRSWVLSLMTDTLFWLGWHGMPTSSSRGTGLDKMVRLAMSAWRESVGRGLW